MEDPDERAHCVFCARPGPSWHGRGPFLVVHGADADAVDVASSIAQQCRAHEVEVLRVTLDEVPRGRLWAFTSIIFVLPLTSNVEVRPTLMSCVQILDIYRARRRDGLAEVARLPWYYRGTVVWVGPRALLDNPLLIKALQRSDARYVIEDGPADVFHPFGPS